MEGKDTRTQLIRRIAERATLYGFASVQDAKDAWRLVKEIDGYDPPNKGCSSCIKRCINILRAQVGMEPVQREMHPRLWKARLAICEGGCPAYHKNTQSCGRLGLDALYSQTVDLPDGRTIKPCGCYIPAKARFANQQCPAGFWPEVKE